MNTYEKSLQVMNELFAKDYQFALATTKDNRPAVRVVDTFFDEGSFYVVSHSKSQKVQELETNSSVALCSMMFRFSGNAYNIGHPLLPENNAIREKLMNAFALWYTAHNSEEDENMCYVKIVPDDGFIYKDGTGYKVDFQKQIAEQFPFEFQMVL